MQEWATNRLPHMASSMKTSQVSKQPTPGEGSSNDKGMLATRETYMEENVRLMYLGGTVRI